MAVPPNKRREAPSEPLKRVLGPTVRAIAGDGEIEVDFGPGKGEVAGKSVIIPEPPRTPSAKDIALARGWADSLALRIGCHDATIHRRLAPPAGPARAVFEAAERAASRGWARRECRAWPAILPPVLKTNIAMTVSDWCATALKRRSKTRWRCSSVNV